MRLRLPALTYPLQHHMPHRLLGFFPSAMPGYQIQAQINSRSRTGTGDQIAFVDEQMIDRCRGLGKPCAKRIQHIPVHAHRTTPHHARLRQRKSPGADAQ
ncbi:hypothetical protein D3C85_1390360 [compost metagenome]